MFISEFLIPSLCAAPEDLLLSKKNCSLLSKHRALLQTSSVVVTDEKRKSIGYGALVSAQGHILTKASLLTPQQTYLVRLDKTEFSPTLLHTSEKWDLALLQIPFTGGAPVRFKTTPIPLGSIVISNGVTSLLQRRLKFGVISAKARAISADVACFDFLAEYHPSKRQFVVKHLFKKGQAESAGLKVGDLLLSLDGQSLNDPHFSFSDYCKGKWPSDSASLTILRKRHKKKLSLPYRWKHEISSQAQDRNEAMSGRISKRRTGFPTVIQHDIALSSRSVGGPLLSLDGSCIGLNIARFSRAETYAIPASALQTLLQQWIPENPPE